MNILIVCMRLCRRRAILTRAQNVRSHVTKDWRLQPISLYEYRGRDAKVPAAKGNSHRLMPLRQGSAVTQTTNFRGQPRAAPRMSFRGL